MLSTVILVIQVVSAIALVGFVLLQQGKGADAGASFGGGASQTVFGSSGTGNFLTRMTALFAVVFFCCSLGLAHLTKKAINDGSSLNFELPAAEAGLGGEGVVPDQALAPAEMVISSDELPVETALPEGDLPVPVAPPVSEGGSSSDLPPTGDLPEVPVSAGPASESADETDAAAQAMTRAEEIKAAAAAVNAESEAVIDAPVENK